MGLKILLDKPGSHLLSMILVISLIFAGICMVAFSKLMATFPIGAGLMDIKNAWNLQNLSEIFTIWASNTSQNYILLMTKINDIDFGFMIFYSTALFCGLLLITRKIQNHMKLQNLFLSATVLCPLGALICDIIEGIFIATMLTHPELLSNTIAFGSSLSAFICMIFLYIGIGLILIGMIIRIIDKKR